MTRVACALLASALIGGCLEATQIEVELTTDVNCADRPATTINVGTLGELESAPPVAVTNACEPQTGRVGSIVVLPHESKEGQVGIEVIMGIAKGAEQCRRDNFVGGCIVARRAMNFVKHRSLRLPIELEAACVDVPCGATETCRKGSCVSAQVDPNTCISEEGCTIAAPNGGAGIGGAGVGGTSTGGAGVGDASTGGSGVGGSGVGGSGVGGSGVGGSGVGGASTGGADSGGTEGQAGEGSLGDAGQTSTFGGSPGQSSAGAGGQAASGAGGQGSGGSAGQPAGGSAGQPAGGAAGQASAGSAGQLAGGAAGSGGAPQLGPVLVASDSKSSSGLVSTISPNKALLPEHPGDILFAWVCIASQFGAASPQNSAFWKAYTTAPGVTLLLAQARCQVFTATATGGSESHAFSIFPASSATIQRLEFSSAKPPPPSPQFESGYPTSTPSTKAMTVSQNHSALLYFFGVSGATLLASINIATSGQTTAMLQISSSGLNPLTSGFAVAFDQPAGIAPKVTYAPTNTGVWSTAGTVLSPAP